MHPGYPSPTFSFTLFVSAQVVLLPLAYMYHRINDGSGKTDVVSVLQRHSVLPLAKLVRMAAFLNAFYCVSDYFWFRALANISVAMGGAIFNTSPLSVYCFSICFLHERASLRKLAGVLTAFAGVSLIIFFQDDGSGAAAPSSSPEGASFLASFLVLIAATIYAGYEVAVRVVIGEDVHDLSTLVILTGLCGVFTIPIWTIGSLLLAWSPFPSFYEPLGWPETSEGIAYLMLSGSLAGVLTLLLSIALCWTSPLETSVGGMLGLPASVIWDMVAHSMRFPWPCFVGSVFVMAGFALLEFASIRAMIQTKLLQPKRSEPVP